MNDDNGFGVPAGWYPDPLGLPQMRWWDNHGWTEHTTEARAPIVIQEAKLAWADDDLPVDELPTRRERRERERNDGTADGTVASAAPTADALLELEPPSWDELPADEPAPELPSSFVPAQDEPQRVVVPEQVVPEQSIPAPAAQPVAPAEPLVRPATAQATPSSAPSANTAGAWIIALLPLAQLVGILLMVAAAGSTGTNIGVVLGILIAPYVIAIPFAISDRRSLRAHGYDHPASWLWVFLSGPVYLIARAIRIVMRAGNGFGPILVWSALVLLQLGSIVAVPGLVVSALPQTFSQEAAQSIEHDASVFGPDMKVTCPTPPATVMGQEFTCTMHRAGSGKSYQVTASLQRENGWIAWRVDDWGNYTLSR